MRLSLDQRKNADAMLNAMRVLNGTVDESKQGIILATTDIGAGVDVRTALTDEDSTGGYGLTGKALAAQTLTTGVAAVTRRAKTFFVCMSITYFLTVLVRDYSAAGASAAASVVAAALRARVVAWTLVIFRRVSC